jgi:hypothetical protein
MFDVLSAEKALQGSCNARTTPTPSGLSASICGIAIEILNGGQKEQALATLAKANLTPKGVHELG